MDKWLKTAARNADRSGTARTFVWANDRDVVVGYISLCPHEIRRETLPTKMGRGSPDMVPAILLARLATDLSLHGQPEGFGSQILVDALSRAVAAIAAAGGRFIVVDAIDDPAESYYVHHGFMVMPGTARRLVLKASVAQASLQKPAPS